MQQTLSLPVILERLSPQARSWMIAKSSSEECTPEKLAIETIEAAAARDGFHPPAAPAGEIGEAA